MAILKHISSKNANYGDAEKYLTFEHDEFTMKPTLDADGRLIPRVDYRISSLNCGGEDFAVACMRSNLRYGKNQKREDVKSHHYIISFDPRDGPDNGLTVDRAQELGEKFCAEHFPGHQALVCTHPDGHSHTENIHVHIVINSLRIAEVPMLPHMDRPADRKAGCKHRCTDAAMNYLKAEVMEMCHSEGLYQIDLLNGSKERITEREYWAQKKGQAALDRANAPIAADGIAPRQTKFETDKAKLRRTIREALAAASGFDEFAALLLRHGVTVKESRGRLSYLTPDRTKPITARKLGDDFDRAAVLSVLEQNAARAAEKPAAIAEYPGSIKDRLRTKKEAKNAPNNDAVQRMVDIAAKRAEGKGRGYEKWATMHNLKQMSATLMLYQQYGFSSPDELDAAISAANTATQESLAGLKGLEAAIREKKELQRNLLGYCLLPTTKGQKMLMLIGKGGEGKSRIGLVMRSLLGDSMNTTSIQKVESNRFSRADLENKLLMVDDDMDMSALPKTNYIKSIVTSECKMDMERKGVQSYQSQLYVRFLCFGNGALTALHDKSDGFFRRQIVLTTKDRPAGRADDPFLVDKLLREKEGIFLWCLEGLHRLIRNNYQFSISGKAKENMETVKRSSNNVIEFLQSEGYIRFRADSEASSKAIYEAYTRWCDDNAQKPMSANRVSSELAQNERLYNVEATNNVHAGGKRVRGFVGIEVVNPLPY